MQAYVQRAMNAHISCRKHIFRCEICLNKVKQQMNGKVIYKEIPIPQILLDF